MACGSWFGFGRDTSAVGMGPARCTAAGAQEYLGQEFDAHTADNARAHAGALRSRVIRQGESVSMDIDPLRLNVEIDDTGRVHRLRCG